MVVKTPASPFYYDYPVKKPKIKPHKDTFHSSIGPFLLMAQFFGILPFSGALEDNVKLVKFKWMSFPVIFSVIGLMLSGIEIIFTTRQIVMKGFNLFSAGPVMFYLTCFTGMIIFFRLAQKWPDIIRKWVNIDEYFLKEPYVAFKSKTTIGTKFRWVGWTLLIAAAIEHCLYLANAIHNNKRQITNCNLTVDFWENFFRRERGHLYEVITFEFWLVPVLEWVNISMTFCWNFVDIFITLVAMGLSERFNQILRKIQHATQKVLLNDFWVDIREDFMKLNYFLRFVDDNMAGLILLSLSNNFYFICVNVFGIFRTRDHLLEEVYFWFLLCFIVSRACLLLFSAAKINEISHQILIALQDIPSNTWNIELQRLMDILATETIGLSGKQFFYLTRNLIFGMAGTIVGYELVLLDQAVESIAKPNFCYVLKRKL